MSDTNSNDRVNSTSSDQDTSFQERASENAGADETKVTSILSAASSTISILNSFLKSSPEKTGSDETDSPEKTGSDETDSPILNTARTVVDALAILNSDKSFKEKMDEAEELFDDQTVEEMIGLIQALPKLERSIVDLINAAGEQGSPIEQLEKLLSSEEKS